MEGIVVATKREARSRSRAFEPACGPIRFQWVLITESFCVLAVSDGQRPLLPNLGQLPRLPLHDGRKIPVPAGFHDFVHNVRARIDLGQILEHPTHEGMIGPDARRNLTFRPMQRSRGQRRGVAIAATVAEPEVGLRGLHGDAGIEFAGIDADNGRVPHDRPRAGGQLDRENPFGIALGNRPARPKSRKSSGSRRERVTVYLGRGFGAVPVEEGLPDQ
jgi:hypothetical protein